MAPIVYEDDTNLENSLYDFLSAKITSESLTVIGENGDTVTPTLTLGWKFNSEWSLPVISLYVDSTNPVRSFVGNNRRIETFLIIVDIRALNDGMQKNLTRWVIDKINDGFPFYEYTPAGNNPTKTQTGYVTVDFNTNNIVRLGDDSALADKYRQNLSISAFITTT